MKENKKTYQGIGTMTGTSLDGMDIAVCTFTVEEDHYDFHLDLAGQVEFDETWKTRLKYLIDQSAEVYAKTHVYFGHWMGRELRAFIEANQLNPDFVAVHGQTIFHQPHKNFTSQIGDGETIVSYLNCPLVSNFRNKDVALGGEGAPLVPMGEKYLLRDHKLFLNLGGICNLAFEGIAFDITFCNLVLNLLYQRLAENPATDYDPEGQTARSGELNSELLQQLNSLPFFAKKPPKSLGWEWVEEEVLPIIKEFELPLADLLHTCCVHIAEQIAISAKQVGAQGEKMLITGGGKHNTFLLEQIEGKLSKVGIAIDQSISDDIIDYKEAIVFAFLGLRTLLGKPTTLASVTGAEYDVITGSVHLPGRGGYSFF